MAGEELWLLENQTFSAAKSNRRQTLSMLSHQNSNGMSQFCAILE